jgi:4'-phosphopantetheinyl transferase
MPEGVHIEIRDRATTPRGDRQALAALVAPLTISRDCAACGGDHGRPNVSGGRTWASLSRAGGSVAFAISTVGPVGIDLESLAEVARFPLETGSGPFGTAELWTMTEATLKVDGRGLEIDPQELRFGAGPVLADWRGASFDPSALQLEQFVVDDDVIGCVALLRTL